MNKIIGFHLVLCVLVLFVGFCLFVDVVLFCFCFGFFFVGGFVGFLKQIL